MSLQLAFAVFENVQSIHPLTIDNSKNDGLGTWKPQSVPRKMDLHFCAISLAYLMIFKSEAAMWNLKNYLKLNKKNIYLIYILIITYIMMEEEIQKHKYILKHIDNISNTKIHS